MKTLIPRPAMVLEAASESEGMPWLKELLWFIMVGAAAILLQTILSFIAELVYVGTLDESILEDPDLLTLPSYVSAMLLIRLFSAAGILLVPILYCRFVEKRPLATMGLRRPHAVRELLLGAAVGIGLFGAALGLLLLTGAAAVRPAAAVSVPALLAFFLAYCIQGSAEEVLFRGYLCVSLSRRSPMPAAVLLSSLLFAAGHLANDGLSVLALVNLTLFGVFSSLYMLRRGSLWGICILHALWNFVEGNVFGAAVSGTETGASLLVTQAVGASPLLSGGAFGPEGGLCVTIVFAAGIAVLLFVPQTGAGAEPAVEEAE